MIDLLTEFPELPRTVLRDIKKTVDLGFKDFSRAYGESIEGFFYPLLKLLVFIEDVLIATPWPIIIGICLLYTSPSPRDRTRSRMPSSA